MCVRIPEMCVRIPEMCVRIPVMCVRGTHTGPPFLPQADVLKLSETARPVSDILPTAQSTDSLIGSKGTCVRVHVYAYVCVIPGRETEREKTERKR